MTPARAGRERLDAVARASSAFAAVALCRDAGYHAVRARAPAGEQLAEGVRRADQRSCSDVSMARKASALASTVGRAPTSLKKYGPAGLPTIAARIA